jgi:hypothetical protein
MDYVESMGSPWKPVGDCKVEKGSLISDLEAIDNLEITAR